MGLQPDHSGLVLEVPSLALRIRHCERARAGLDQLSLPLPYAAYPQ